MVLADMGADTWRQVFDTNVIGAALVTAAAIPHLAESSGATAVYLSSVSASVTSPWPGLGSYAVSKAALDKLVEAWRGEHPTVGFTRLVVGECMGGEGDSVPGFADGWDQELAAEVMPVWFARNYMSGYVRRRRESPVPAWWTRSCARAASPSSSVTVAPPRRRHVS